MKRTPKFGDQCGAAVVDGSAGDGVPRGEVPVGAELDVRRWGGSRSLVRHRELCCKKNLPLNFPDSLRMLKRISSQFSPDKAQSATAKEVARAVINSTSDGKAIKWKEVDRAAAMKAHELV
jgi:hypothetical protein